jgi:hypothetical protein
MKFDPMNPHPPVTSSVDILTPGRKCWGNLRPRDENCLPTTACGVKREPYLSRYRS